MINPFKSHLDDFLDVCPLGIRLNKRKYIIGKIQLGKGQNEN
jgi:hypothetical protein